MNSNGIRLCIAYATALIASLWLSYQLRFDFAVPESTARTQPFVFTWVIGLKLLCLWRARQFDVMLGHFSLQEYSKLFWILLFTGIFVFGVSSHLGSDYAPPRSVVLADGCVSLVALSAIRLVFHEAAARARARSQTRPRQRARRAGIIGAGVVGTALAQEFANRHDLGLQAVAFFDDDRLKWGKRVLDVPVLGAPEILLQEHQNLELEEIVIAMPGAPSRRVSEIVKTLERLRFNFSTVPSTYELTTGQARVSQLRALDPQMLLGREPVRLATDEIEVLLRDRVVLVTGAGGSIGSELCRQIVSHSPRALLLVEQSEVQLFQIEQELVGAGKDDVLVPLVANVLDAARMEAIVRQYQPSVVFHAAAHKHVPMMETQPGEAVKNNALGTLRMAELCQKHRVGRFVLISTDKAINPTNVMGASKRLAEMCVQSLFAANPNGTRLMAVRFGNVLGSSGSVVPIFVRQIAAGGPVKVTHPDVIRYFMTIPEAVGLVLQSAALGSGGEIFTLDMGKPVRILDLARRLIELSGFTPDQEIKIEFTGLRPGEKLFEELSYRGERIASTAHPKILKWLGTPQPLHQVRRFVTELMAQMDRVGADEFKCLLQCAVPEYQPQFRNGTSHPKLHTGEPPVVGDAGKRNGVPRNSEPAPTSHILDASKARVA